MERQLHLPEIKDQRPLAASKCPHFLDVNKKIPDNRMRFCLLNSLFSFFFLLTNISNILSQSVNTCIVVTSLPCLGINDKNVMPQNLFGITNISRHEDNMTSTCHITKYSRLQFYPKILQPTTCHLRQKRWTEERTNTQTSSLNVLQDHPLNDRLRHVTYTCERSYRLRYSAEKKKNDKLP